MCGGGTEIASEAAVEETRDFDHCLVGHRLILKLNGRSIKMPGPTRV
jgi:hypothetical protein